MTQSTRKKTILAHTLSNISKSKDSQRPGRFHGIAGNAENHGKNGKFHNSDQILNQTKRNMVEKLFPDSFLKNQN